MKNILFLLLLPFASYSQQKSTVPTTKSVFSIDFITGTDQDRQTFFFVGKHNYRDSVEYMTMTYDSTLRSLVFYLDGNLVSYYHLKKNNDYLITNLFDGPSYFSARMPEHFYKIRIKHLSDKVVTMSIENWGQDFELMEPIYISCQITTGTFNIQPAIGADGLPLYTLPPKQRMRLFSF